ncbi:hypothetical protein R50072_13460 [Simiduia litorea]|uniref:HNH endonuclease n=1 Tax=Simiduia litorea TaxID=1435348 RepID=UPI0036F440CD
MQPLTQAYLQECFTYRPDAGTLRWKERPRKHFRSLFDQLDFNEKYSGREIENQTYKDNTEKALRVNDKYSAHPKRIIWCLMTGSYPARAIGFVSGNKQDLRWCNLCLVSKLSPNYRYKKRDSEASFCVSTNVSTFQILK